MHKLNEDTEMLKVKHENVLETLKSEHNATTENYDNELYKSREEGQILQKNVTSLENKLSE